MIGYVVVELDPETDEPESPTSLFAWDGGTVYPTEGAAQHEADHAGVPGERFVYKVATVELVES